MMHEPPHVKGSKEPNAIRAFHRAFSVLVVASLALASCGILAGNASPPHRETPSIAFELVDRSLITGEPCGPPCWQGIIPGETTESEAMAILRTLFFVDGDTIRVQGNTIYWYSDIENWPGGGIEIGGNRTVDWVDYGLPYYLELQALIDARGEPEAFVFQTMLTGDGWYAGDFSFELFWPEDGFSVYVYAHTEDPQMICEVSPFTPEMPVYAVRYFEPVSSVEAHAELTGQTWLQSLIEEGYYHEWNGYQPIDCGP
jgi:hypothetical protein